MPRTRLACSSPDRASIERALVSGEPLRNIAKRVSISPAGLLRHKNHVAHAIVRAGERREERLGDNLLDEMRRVQRKAWELLAKTESEGDHRASIVALREVRECLESLGEMLAKATTPQGSQFDLAQRIEAARRRVGEHKEAEINARVEELLKQRAQISLESQADQNGRKSNRIKATHRSPRWSLRPLISRIAPVEGYLFIVAPFSCLLR